MTCRLWILFFSYVLIPDAWGSGLQVKSTVHNIGIYGGHDVSIKETPYMVGIYGSSFLNWFYRLRCGGSVIHEKFVLTAAHCMGYYSIMVAVGSNQIDSGEFISVEKRIIRNDYDNTQLYNDISLLKLVKPLQFGPTVALVRLPEEGFELATGTLVTVTGWGGTETGDTVAKTLRQVTVPILPKWHCSLDSQICAGTQGFGTCNGDSGGPLVHDNVIIGVVSYRRQESCAGPFGTVYIRVASYSKWIKSYLH